VKRPQIIPKDGLCYEHSQVERYGHVYDRIRLKYSSFRPGNGDRIRCTVLQFNYGIIRRHNYATTQYLRHLIKVLKIHN